MAGLGIEPRTYSQFMSWISHKIVYCAITHLFLASRQHEVVIDGTRLDGVDQVDHHLAVSQYLVLKIKIGILEASN